MVVTAADEKGCRRMLAVLAEHGPMPKKAWIMASGGDYTRGIFRAYLLEARGLVRRVPVPGGAKLGYEAAGEWSDRP